LRIVRSYAQFYAGSSGACINDDDAPSMEVVDAVAVINLDDKFTPPFTMK
jgi:FtsP/CotA-like multicopper oxidase with cupredoxin domain